MIDGLRIVDGRELPEAYRIALRPGETVVDASNREFRLPRYFYEVDSWKTARAIELAPAFGLYEFISIDVREAPELRSFPRYLPLAITHLAAHLALLRSRLGTYVHIAANGGYRSPAHEAGFSSSVHCWGTAANVYRIGDDLLNTEEKITRYAEIVAGVLPAARTRPFGRFPGGTIDHLHLDLGRFVMAPTEDLSVDGEQRGA